MAGTVFAGDTDLYRFVPVPSWPFATNRFCPFNRRKQYGEKWIQRIEQISEIESLPDSGVESNFSMINVDQDLNRKTDNLNDSYFD